MVICWFLFLFLEKLLSTLNYTSWLTKNRLEFAILNLLRAHEFLCYVITPQSQSRWPFGVINFCVNLNVKQYKKNPPGTIYFSRAWSWVSLRTLLLLIKGQQYLFLILISYQFWWFRRNSQQEFVIIPKKFCGIVLFLKHRSSELSNCFDWLE